MKQLIAIIVIALASTCAHADVYSYLNFVKAEASGTSVNAQDIKVTFNGNTAIITSGGNTTTLPLTGVNYLEFSNTLLNDTPAEPIMGDVNGDGIVDVEDVNSCINTILSTEPASLYEGRADVNGDGIVDVEDVNMIINIILGL